MSLPRWYRSQLAAPSHPRPPERPAPGDALAAQIERRVLGPAERALPAAAPLARALRRCGGCAHARHQLGSVEPHPDASAPVL